MTSPYIKEVFRRYTKQEQMGDWIAPLPYQKAPYLDTAFIQVFGGSNRSGKTEIATKKVVDIIIGVHPTITRKNQQRVRYITPTLKEGALDIALEKFKKFIPVTELRGKSWDKGFIKDNRKIYFRNGSTIQLMANTQDIENFQGASLDIVIFDEEPSEKVFNENITRLADRKGFAILAFTPHKGITWSHQRLVKPAQRGYNRVSYFYLDVLKNYKIPREEHIKSYSVKTQREIEVSLYGKFIANEGIVYSNFDPEVNICKPFVLPPGTQLYIGIDYGFNNPAAAIFLALTPDNSYYIIDEYYETGKIVEQFGRDVAQIAKKYSDLRIRFIVGDPNSGAQRSEQTGERNADVFKKAFIEEYRATISMRAGEKGPGVVEHRINEVNTAFLAPKNGSPKLIIFSTCLYTLDEIENYIFPSRREDINKFEKPKEFKNHLMNAMEYIIEQKPKHFVQKPRQTVNYYQYGQIPR